MPVAGVIVPPTPAAFTIPVYSLPPLPVVAVAVTVVVEEDEEEAEVEGEEVEEVAGVCDNEVEEAEAVTALAAAAGSIEMTVKNPGSSVSSGEYLATFPFVLFFPKENGNQEVCGCLRCCCPPLTTCCCCCVTSPPPAVGVVAVDCESCLSLRA